MWLKIPSRHWTQSVHHVSPPQQPGYCWPGLLRDLSSLCFHSTWDKFLVFSLKKIYHCVSSKKSHNYPLHKIWKIQKNIEKKTTTKQQTNHYWHFNVFLSNFSYISFLLLKIIEMMFYMLFLAPLNWYVVNIFQVTKWPLKMWLLATVLSLDWYILIYPFFLFDDYFDCL